MDVIIGARDRLIRDLCLSRGRAEGAITVTVAWEKFHLRDARQRVGRVHERRGTAVNGVPESRSSED